MTNNNTQERKLTSFPHPHVLLCPLSLLEKEILVFDVKTEILFIIDDVEKSKEFFEDYPNPNDLIFIEKKEVLTGVSTGCR